MPSNVYSHPEQNISFILGVAGLCSAGNTFKCKYKQPYIIHTYIVHASYARTGTKPVKEYKIHWGTNQKNPGGPANIQVTSEKIIR